VRLHGEAVEADSPETRARKGMVRTFQITRELTGMRVIDNMRLGAQEHPGEGVVPALFETSDVTDRERTIDERADELLERLDLDHLREEYAGNLSGGQRKLLELGRALMADPDLLLLDEPMAGVNPSLTGDLVAMIRELRDDGMTFLIVEHDIDLIMSLSDKVVGMHDGRVLTTGPPGVVKNDDALLEAYLGGEV